MAFKSGSISLFLLLAILLAMTGHVLARRAGPTKKNEEDKKQPEWFIGRDGSVLIPGAGRILVPMPGTHRYNRITPIPNPNYGGGGAGGGAGAGSNSGSTHIPGGDDTFVPNPGFEVPAPSAP